MTYVKGSHQWGQEYKPESFKKSDEGDAYLNELLKENNKAQQRISIENISKHPEDYEFLSWDVAPGDILLHNALCIHGAKGNTNATRSRRALATRWLGDDARWDLNQTNLMKLPMIPDMDIPSAADHFDDQFPLLWKG